MQSPAIKQALGILKQLRQIMETPESVPDKLSRILQTIAAKMAGGRGRLLRGR